MEWRLFVLSIVLFFWSFSKQVETLQCYECEEDFEHIWDPYTYCQIYPNLTASKQCLADEIYCMVKRVSFKGMTISIERKCTDSCWYGCRAKDFGITKLTCISCCQNNLCNVGGRCSRMYASVFLLAATWFLHILK